MGVSSGNTKRPCPHCGERYRGGLGACAACRRRLGLDLAEDDELTGGAWVLKGAVKVYVVTTEPVVLERLPTDVNPGYQCGTPRAYRKHTRMKQIPCDDCLAAIRIYQRMRRYGRTDRIKIDAQCGTYSGYNRHTRKREKPCDECRKAANEYFREYRAKTRSQERKAA